MPDRKLNLQRIKRLLDQDPNITPKNMQEVRMQFEQNLTATEAKAKQTRRRILVAICIYVAATFGYLFYLSQWGNATPDIGINQMRQFILIPLVILALLAFVLGVVLAGLYLFQYGPRLSRARFDLQTAMLLELQHELRQLREGRKPGEE